MTLRRAQVADLPFILRCERSYIRDIEPAAEARWTNALDRNLQFWIACLPRTQVLVAGEAVAGYYMWTTDGNAAVLASIHVLPEHRRSGWGAMLLQAFVDEARSAGFDRLTLGVETDNPARSLYEVAGFEFTHQQDGYRYYALGG